MPYRGLPIEDHRSDWVRLRTTIWVRWIAIAGQTTALGVAEWGLGIDARLGSCSLLITLSAMLNLALGFLYPRNTRLTARQSMLMLLFDLSQLFGLLALTGGLTNPFAMLVVVPVAISATALPFRHTVVVAGYAICLTPVVSFFSLPLRLADGSTLVLPPLFEIGEGSAIVLTILFLSIYVRRVSIEVHRMSEALMATQMALAREQKLTDLTGVVAAAAHELGTPLATIKLASSELIHELKDRPELADDARLIHEQAGRCRDILRSMGKAGKRDLYTARAPLTEVLREAAEPHVNRGKTVHFVPAGTNPPIVERRPEVIHALRNLIQNAVDFAASSVWIESEWRGEVIDLHVIDDGAGFSQSILARLGDPFLQRRDRPEEERPGYEGMGLGLFISKTLLERTGAEIEFFNHSRADRGGQGAMVRLTWPSSARWVSQPGDIAIATENPQIEA